jgi:hypothetical protein
MGTEKNHFRGMTIMEAPTPASRGKEKTTAGIFGLLLGGFGVH